MFHPVGQQGGPNDLFASRRGENTGSVWSGLFCKGGSNEDKACYWRKLGGRRWSSGEKRPAYEYCGASSGAELECWWEDRGRWQLGQVWGGLGGLVWRSFPFWLWTKWRNKQISTILTLQLKMLRTRVTYPKEVETKSGSFWILSISSLTFSSERVNWPSRVVKVVPRSRSTDLFKCSGGGISNTGWVKSSVESLVKTEAHGVKRICNVKTNGTETVIWAGHWPRPVVIVECLSGEKRHQHSYKFTSFIWCKNLFNLPEPVFSAYNF